MLIDILAVTGLLAAAGVFGSMLFFSAVVAPLVFIRLEAATAGQFIRGLFPSYYLFVLALAAIAAAATASPILPNRTSAGWPNSSVMIVLAVSVSKGGNRS